MEAGDCIANRSLGRNGLLPFYLQLDLQRVVKMLFRIERFPAPTPASTRPAPPVSGCAREVGLTYGGESCRAPPSAFSSPSSGGVPPSPPRPGLAGAARALGPASSAHGRPPAATTTTAAAPCASVSSFTARSHSRAKAASPLCPRAAAVVHEVAG